MVRDCLAAFNEIRSNYQQPVRGDDQQSEFKFVDFDHENVSCFNNVDKQSTGGGMFAIDTHVAQLNGMTGDYLYNNSNEQVPLIYPMDSQLEDDSNRTLNCAFI